MFNAHYCIKQVSSSNKYRTKILHIKSIYYIISATFDREQFIYKKVKGVGFVVWYQAETYFPTSQLPRWSLEKTPLLQIELSRLWQSHGQFLDIYSVRSQFPLSSLLTLGRRWLMWIPISKIRHNLWKLAQCRDLNPAGPHDLESFALLPKPRNPHIYSSKMLSLFVSLAILLIWHKIQFIFYSFINFLQATGFFKDPLTRQINESVRIANTTNNMNRKNAWKKTAVPLDTFIRQ